MATDPLNTNVSNFHVQYMDVTSQHWNPESEQFAGGDHLMTALNHGWDVARCVETRHWFAGMRSVTIYRFELERKGEKMSMPVLTNPYVSRLIRQMGYDIIKEDADTKSA
jgi:hypothetical protein